MDTEYRINGKTAAFVERALSIVTISRMLKLLQGRIVKIAEYKCCFRHHQC